MQKILVLLVCILVFNCAGITQTPKKPEKEKAPTQKEMEDMMKDAQKMMDNELSAEDKKMMDSMGFKMPDMKAMQKKVAGVSDAQLKKAFDDANRIVPLKDQSRIDFVAKNTITASSLAAFLQSAHNSVIAQLKPASRSKAEEIYAVVRSQPNKGNTAAALWMLGKAELALYVMGKACIDDPTNTDNQNNYASMLSMGGAEQLAIPLLDNLNKQFPNNSTILNNLGQAWFGLGEITKAEKYLDDVIRIYAYHPQANYTKSFIEESKGNQTAAIALVKKSIKHAYSQEKEERLRKMGQQLEVKDIRLPFKPTADPLNLSAFKYPDFPKSVDESIVFDKLWAEHKQQCYNEVQNLKVKLEQATQVMLKMNEQRQQDNMGIIKASLNAGYVTENLTLMPFYAPQATLKLREIIDSKGGYAEQWEKAGKDMAAYIVSTVPLRKQYNEAMRKLDKEDEEQTGEGKPNVDFCPRKKAVADAYLAAYNPGCQQKWEAYLDVQKRRLNEETYWYQYVQWPDQFEVTKLNAKISWLSAIGDAHYESITAYRCNPPNLKKGGKLAEFDDIACKYHSELKTPVGTIKTDCSRMTTELDLKFVKLGLKQNMDKETFNDQFMSCSVEVGVSAGAGIKNGPLKAEASIGAAVGAEFDRNGLKDVVVKVNAGISAGTDMIEGGSMAGVGVSDLSADVGVQGQVSLISGKSSVESTGLLQGVFKK